MRKSVVLALCVVGFSASSSAAWANAKIGAKSEPGIPTELKDVGITENLGKAVSIQDLRFKDEQGADVPLSKFFSPKKPILLTLVYYQCPSLCNFLLNGLVESLVPLKMTVGKEFDIVTVSINPNEGPELASRKKTAYLSKYGREGAAQGWHFLTGQEEQIRQLAGEVGFGYKYDEKDGQYAHSAAVFLLTPDGKISRYLYGISYSEKDLRLGLVEASQGQIGTVIDRFLMFCYRYDPKQRKYSIYLTKIMQAGGAGTVLIFGGYLAVFWRRQRKFNNQKWGSLADSKDRQGG